MDRSTHEEHLSQPLQTNNKRFKVAVNLTGYNGIFSVINSNNKFYFARSITYEDGFIQITVPPSDYEIEALNKEIKGSITEKGCFTQTDYPFTIKPNISTLGSIIKISYQGKLIRFLPYDRLPDLLGSNATKLHEEYSRSRNAIDVYHLIIFSSNVILLRE